LSTADHTFAVILAGGAGTRFWPISTEDRPKQFCDVLNTGRTLLQMTYDRVAAFVNPKQILVVTQGKYLALISQQLPMLDTNQIILEPQRKNTAPAITLAAFYIRTLDPHSNMLVVSSDQIIMDTEAFTKAMERAISYISAHRDIMVFGIKPTRPDTGYGYLQLAGEKEMAFLP